MGINSLLSFPVCLAVLLRIPAYDIVMWEQFCTTVVRVGYKCRYTLHGTRLRTYTVQDFIRIAPVPIPLQSIIVHISITHLWATGILTKLQARNLSGSADTHSISRARTSPDVPSHMTSQRTHSLSGFQSESPSRSFGLVLCPA